MAISLHFGTFKNLWKQEVIREGHEASTRVEGAPTLTGHAPCLMGTSCTSRTLFSCTLLLLVGKNSLYNLPKGLTTVSRKNLLFLFRAVFLTDLEHHDIFKRSQGQVFREGHQPLSRRCCITLKPLRCVRGCCTSAMWRDQGVPEAWRQSSKRWNNKFSSAKGWWSADLTPTR